MRFKLLKTKLLLTVLIFCTSVFGGNFTADTLPKDTFAFLYVSDIEQVITEFKKTSWYKLYESEDFRTFRGDSIAKMERRIINPIKKELDINLYDYAKLLDGELLIALIPSEKFNNPLNDSCFIAVESKKNSKQLKEMLLKLKSTWEEKDRNVPTQIIENVDFMRFDIPREIIESLILQLKLSPEELMSGNGILSKTISLWVAITDSHLILSLGDISIAQKALAAKNSKNEYEQLRGFPPYVEQIGFLKDSPGGIWVNVKAIAANLQETLDLSMKLLKNQTEEQGKKLNPLYPDPSLFLKSLHLETVHSVAVVSDLSGKSFRTRFNIVAPQNTRNGATKFIGTLNVTNCNTPDFTPKNALSCARLRMDFPKALKILDEITDEAYPLKEFLFLSFEEGYERSLPNFDWQKNLFSLTGNDLICMELRNTQDSQKIDTLYLLQSPRSEELIHSVINLFKNSKNAVGIEFPYDITCKTNKGIPFYTATYKLIQSQETSQTNNVWSNFYACNAGNYLLFSDSAQAVVETAKLIESTKNRENIPNTGISFFEEKNSLAVFEILWEKFHENSQEQTIPFPFPLNRLNYDKLPPFDICKDYLTKASIFYIKPTPQGLEGANIEILP